MVTTAVPLSDGQKQRLSGALAKLYGRAVLLNIDVDPEVVGGVRVQIGDEIIDGTVSSRLAGARQALEG
jgi:F-type H+-transporting ATPase subunit delta